MLNATVLGYCNNGACVCNSGFYNDTDCVLGGCFGDQKNVQDMERAFRTPAFVIHNILEWIVVWISVLLNAL